MPKSYPHKGLIAVGGGGVGRRLLEKRKLGTDPVACARVHERRVRDVIEATPELAVWIGSRLYVLDKKEVLDAFAVALGLELPATARPARATSASSPSNAKAAA